MIVILDDHADPTALWQYAERYLGVGTRTYSRFSGDLAIDDAYHPQRGRPSFTMVTFWVSHADGEYLTNGFDSELHGLYLREDRFLLPVHPQTLQHDGLVDRELLAGCPRGPVIEAVPSANARTTFVTKVDDVVVPPHFLKLHYPGRLSRFTRRLRRPMIDLQLWAADELARVRAPFLPEVAGGVLGRDRTQAWGYLVREPEARHGQSLGFTVPLFALYGQDYRAPADPTLLEQLVKRSGEAAEAYVTERIIRPMVRLWLSVVLSTGCALDLHGQNTLFTFDDDGAGRILYRDCGVYVDPALRVACGAPSGLPPTNVITRDIAMAREQVLSLVYDSFMSHHVFMFLARVVTGRFGVEDTALREAAKDEFASVDGSANLLPQTVYYYDDVLHPDGAWRLVDTGQAPQWR